MFVSDWLPFARVQRILHHRLLWTVQSSVVDNILRIQQYVQRTFLALLGAQQTDLITE